MVKKPRSTGFSSGNASSSEKARHVLIPKTRKRKTVGLSPVKPNPPFLRLPRELRDKVYQYCHPCLADSTVYLDVEVDRRIHKDWESEFRAWKFNCPGVHVSLDGAPPTPRGLLSSMMINKQIFDEVSGMLQDLKYIIHLDDYYVYKCDTYPHLHIERLEGLPRAKAMCFDFTPTTRLFSSSVAEKSIFLDEPPRHYKGAKKAKYLDMDPPPVRKDVVFPYDTPLAKQFAASYRIPPLREEEPDDFTKKWPQTPGLARQGREKNLREDCG